MPWKVRTVMSEKNSFVASALAEEKSFSALCREYGISRKTGYKWLRRAKEGLSLDDRSRAPNGRPHKTPPEIEEQILLLRDEHPVWGARKLHHVLSERGMEGLPCKSTIDNILKRNARIEPEASEAATPFKRFEMQRPNDLWQMDYKGDFETLRGIRCFPMTMLDDCTRFSLCISSRSGTNYGEFLPVFTRVLEEYGLPEAILCDNGKPWGDSRKGITHFDVWMMRLGVLPIHGRLVHPQTQGKIERFHRTMKQELLKRRPMRDLADAQKAFDVWRQEYNNERPHEALGMATPAQCYKPSARRLEDGSRRVEYDPGARLRKVNYKGYISIQDHRYYISESLTGELIQINDVDENVVALQYGNFEFARIDLSQQLIVSKRYRRVR